MSRPRPQGLGLGILSERLNLTKAKGKSEFHINGSIFETTEADIRNVNDETVLLGSGQYGDVYKKRHVQSGILLAEKVIRKREDPLNRGVSYVDTEKELWKSCKHSCLVNHYGTLDSVVNVKLYFELMDTCFLKLEQKIQDKNENMMGDESIQFPLGIVAKVAKNTLSALQYLFNEHKVIHRDVMPSNVLIGKNGEVKVTDFGFAKKFVDSRDNTRSVGCLLFMAPERTTGEYNQQADVWSVGIMVYELVLLENPIKARLQEEKQQNEMVLMCEIKEGDAPQLSENQGPPDLVKFVNSCLKKDPKERFNLLSSTTPFCERAYSDEEASKWLREL